MWLGVGKYVFNFFRMGLGVNKLEEFKVWVFGGIVVGRVGFDFLFFGIGC